MRRPQRLIATAVLIALSGALAGCGSTAGFDPSDLLDFLDTKKKLPGDRKPVFPEGVPGLEQGVPKDLYRGARQQQMTTRTRRLPLAPPPRGAESEAVQQSKGKQAAARPPLPDPDAAPEEEGSTAAAPPLPSRPRSCASAPPRRRPINRAAARTVPAAIRVPGADAERYVHALISFSLVPQVRVRKRQQLKPLFTSVS